MNEFAFITLCSLTAVLWIKVWPLFNKSVRVPIFVYTSSYFLTYFVGACWIGLTNGEILGSRIRLPDMGRNHDAYWILVFSPFVITPLSVLLFQGLHLRHQEDRPSVRRISSFGLTLIFAVFALYISKTFYSSGHLSLSGLWEILENIGNIDLLYRYRMSAFAQGGVFLFGLIYSTLPALTHVALFHAIKRPTLQWKITFVFFSIVVLILGLATYQIMIPMVFLLSIILSLFHLRVLKIKAFHISISLAIFILVLGSLQYVKRGESSFEKSLMENALRMPHALPYYVECFPDHIAHPGIRLIGDLTGLVQPDPNHSLVIGQFISPYNSIPSYTPAPAHVSAYADNGIFYSLFMLILLGVLIRVVGWIGERSKNSPLWHALYIQTLIMVYYLTQTTLRSALWHSYGIVWTGLGLLLLLVLNPAQKTPITLRKQLPIADFKPFK